MSRIGRYGMVVTTETTGVLRLTLMDVSGRTVAVQAASSSTGRVHRFACNQGGASPEFAPEVLEMAFDFPRLRID